MSNSKNFFLSVTERIFSNWTALKLAVEHGMGSKETAQEFCTYATELIYMNDQLIPVEVAAELEDYMDEEFNTELEDSSTTQIAEELLRFYRYCVTGDEATALTEFEKLPPLQSWITLQVKSTAQSGPQLDDTSSEDEEATNQKMEVADEEWTTVRSSRKNRSGKS